MGTIVIGKVESGTARKGDTYTLMPNRQQVKVMSIIGADELERNSCKAGENVKLKLSGVEEEEVLPGFILCSHDNLCETGTVFDAQVRLRFSDVLGQPYLGFLDEDSTNEIFANK